MEKTIKTRCDSLYKNQKLLSNTNKNQFEKLLRAAQVDGVAIGSPLGPSLPKAFLAHYEQIWLNDCPDKFKRYVEDIFVLSRSPHHLEKFNRTLS